MAHSLRANDAIHMQSTSILSGLFSNEHPQMSRNPLRSIRFDRTIHKHVSEHLLHGHVAPFDSAQIGWDYAKMFYFQFFFGLVSAARLRDGNGITTVYTHESDDQIQLLILYGHEAAELHVHQISAAKLTTINPSFDTHYQLADRKILALCWNVEIAERYAGTGDISIKIAEVYEYDLIPRSTNIEENIGVEMILLKNKRMKRVSSPQFDTNFEDYERQTIMSELPRSSFNSDHPDIYPLLVNFQRPAPRPGMPPLVKQAYTAGYLHGLLFPALGDKYYIKMLNEPFPAIRFSFNRFTLCFPPGPRILRNVGDTYFVIDTEFNNLNRHAGYEIFRHLFHRQTGYEVVDLIHMRYARYDVFDRIKTVLHDTNVVEVRLTQADGWQFFDESRLRTLRWSLQNVAENIHFDVMQASPSDAEVLKHNIEHYSEVLNEILGYRTTKCDLRSGDDLKFFLVGLIRSDIDIPLEISTSRTRIKALRMISRQESRPSPIFTFDEKIPRRKRLSAKELIRKHHKDHGRNLQLNLAYIKGKIDLEVLSVSVVKAKEFAFQSTANLQLMSAFKALSGTDPELQATDVENIYYRNELHTHMKSFFSEVDKLSIPHDSMGPFLAGAFQGLAVQLTSFDISKIDSSWNIRAEVVLNRYRIPICIELFNSKKMEAVKRALTLKNKIGNQEIAMTFNLGNQEDGLAIMTSQAKRYLRTDNVDALCRKNRRKKRIGAFGLCEYSNLKKVIKYEGETNIEQIVERTTRKFPKLKAHLSVLRELTGKIQVGFIGRDIIGGFYRRDWDAVVNSAFFFGTATGSSAVGSLITELGIQKAANGEKLLGSAVQSVGMCLPKIGFDAYMGSQLHEEWKKNDTESAKYTEAYIGIDLIECGLETLEAFSVIPFGTIFTPLLAVLGTSILVAQSIMQTARKIKEITDVVQLSTEEKLYEISREFFLLGTDDIIQSMNSEITANEKMVLRALKQYPSFGRFLTSAAAKVNEDGGITFIHNNVIDLSRKYDFDKSRLMPRSEIIGDNVTIFCAMNEALDVGRGKLHSSIVEHSTALRYISQAASMIGDLRLPKASTYTNPVNDFYCENAFGVINKNRNESSETLYLLFNGTDNVIGFPSSRNVFLLMNGNKSINGGYENDHFVIRAEYIHGYLNGSSGEDVVDFSASDNGKDLIIQNGEAFFSPSHNSSNTLKIYHIESIIGRGHSSDFIEVCNESKIDLGGASHGMDRIVLTSNCRRTSKNLTITLRRNTFVRCDVHDRVRYIVSDDSETELELKAGTHYFQIDSSVKFKDVSIKAWNSSHMISFGNTSVIRIQADDLANVSFFFKKENLVMKMYNQNITLYLQGKCNTFDVIENYAELIENNINIKLIAHCEQGLILLNHNFFMVDLGDQTRLLNVISNGHKPQVHLIGHKFVENYFSISLDGSANENDSFNISIQPQMSESLPCYINLHELTKRIHTLTQGDYGLQIVPRRMGDNIKLFIIAHSHRKSLITTKIILGEVNIIDSYQFLNQISLYIHTKNILSMHQGILTLQPPKVYTSNSTVSLFPGDFEFYSTIDFNLTAVDLRPYRVGDTLLLTNVVSMERISSEQPLTISLVDYFQFEIKYQTLSLSFKDATLDLSTLANETQDIQSMWTDMSHALDDQKE